MCRSEDPTGKIRVLNEVERRMYNSDFREKVYQPEKVKSEDTGSNYS
jgi:hypothetical protein